MKIQLKLLIIVVLILTLGNFNVYSQRDAKNKSNPPHKTVVAKKQNRWVKRVAYHPGWAPRRVYYHRWVYFPKHNFYWDNVKQVYIYRSGLKWVAVATLPKSYVNVDLEKEKSVELTDVDDFTETVYDKNDEHIKTLKVEE
ncbi:hypothetical protein CYCD_18530 [Tenuifilaceae bacterium CYCD]|nr:hypothetical protein CYCD_18530 [Tenuifilaceae bacterium CYCD]